MIDFNHVTNVLLSTMYAAIHVCNMCSRCCSEQQLVDCSGSFGNFGCNGGWPYQADEYLKTVAGDDTEKCYAYKAHVSPSSLHPLPPLLSHTPHYLHPLSPSTPVHPTL